jgi:DNA-binding SARP family transcriptional activator
MQVLVQFSPFWDISFYHSLAAWHALLTDEHSQAVEHQHLAQQACVDGGIPVIEAATRVMGAIVEHEAGNYRAAEKQLQLGLELSRKLTLPAVELLTHLIAAEWALERGDESSCLASLDEGLSIVGEHHVPPSVGWRRGSLARLLALAQQRGVHAQAAQELIDRLALQTEVASAGRPDAFQPIRINVLGVFGVELNGEPLVFAGKAQRRPLELLKVLIASGGDGVQEWVLSDALWPDSDGSAAAMVLTTTLHRLRRLLGKAGQPIKRQSGTLSLSRELCWVDLWELEALLNRKIVAPSPGAQDAAGAEDPAAERVLQLYRPFLGQEEAAWALQCRQRLERRVMDALRAWAEDRVTRRQFEQAIAIYAGAIEIDGLAEDCYRGLMECLVSEGRNAEALAWYDRCRVTLRSTLGVDPSEETTRLREEIAADRR